MHTANPYGVRATKIVSNVGIFFLLVAGNIFWLKFWLKFFLVAKLFASSRIQFVSL